MRDGERLLLVGSLGGNECHPDWLLNLRADPEVEVGGKRSGWHARVTEGEERAALWPKAGAGWRFYESYQRRTDRELPLVVPER